MVSTAAVSKYIKGEDFPAEKQELIQKAKSNQAPEEVVEALEALPEKCYYTMPQVWEAIGEFAPETEEDLPYKTNAELPITVQENLPEHAQDIYREAFSSAWEQYADPQKRRDPSEDRKTVAHKVAWAAVERKYVRDDDHWVSQEEEEED
jgi:cation transport regulator